MKATARPSPPEPPLRPWRALAALGAAWVLSVADARAQSMDLHGRLELQDAGEFSRGDSLASALGAREANDAFGDLRLIWEPAWGRWSLSVHGVVAAEDGPDVRLARADTGLLPTTPPTWFALSDKVFNRGPTLVTASIDRLSLAYASPQTVVRVGRQALTWGSGLVFRPMDLFDPFAPAATDTEYKPGVDMVYLQRLFSDGSDLQLVVAPRPARPGAAPTANDSSAALHYQTVLFGHRTTWLLARDHGDWVGALGVNGALGGATWNLEVVPTGVRREGVRVSGVANISDALTLMGRNATVFAEYFRNGFGAGGGAIAVAGLPPDLKDRLARGQVFDVRRDYLAAGLTLEVNPLFTLAPTLIADLDDGSLFLLAAGAWSLGDNLTLIAGAQAPIGRKGSEFGGLPLTAGSRLLLAPPGRVYLQLRRYF
ncbi:MAG: hypothetical protein JWO83_4169 [Caulobacteraceae bacterium]|nr:hypothetical protein [Caulobacteraceae bacterium]